MTLSNNEALNAAITDCCRTLVAFKDSLDAYLVHSARVGGSIPRAAQAFAGLQPRAQWRIAAISPDSFLRRALPFLDWKGVEGKHQSMTIDPSLIVAGTYNDYRPARHLPISPDAVMSWSDDRVDSAAGDAFRDSAVPRIAQVGDLPLYYSIEGKNRVQLFKRYRTSMRAFVIPSFFPPPQDMTLIPLKPFGQFAVKHCSGELAILPFPEPVVDLLRAYGVAQAPRQFVFGAWRSARDIRQQIVDAQMVA